MPHKERLKPLKYKTIPTHLTESEFNEFVLPYLSYGTAHRGPMPCISAYKMFNYILYVLHSGCQWKLLQYCIDKDENGQAEIHGSPGFCVCFCVAE